MPFLKFIAGLRSSVARAKRGGGEEGGGGGGEGEGGWKDASWRAVRLNIKRVGKFGTSRERARARG